MIIRTATVDDAEYLLAIYAHYVENTAITFECETPSVADFGRRIQKTLTGGYPYLVVEDEGAIQGYAYAGPFVGREAYRHSCELSIYLHHDARKRGYGRALYEALEQRLKAKGILNLYACIGDPIEEDEYLTRNSEHFHAHLGFQKVGTFHKCGRKFDRWYNMVWMEKFIGTHDEARG